MSPSLEVGDFLRYEADYRILICKDCQYAIQKSALESHLLRHKIYRGHRQRLLTSIGNLELLEPEDVQLPPPTTPPIENLPVIPGYRCVAQGCGALCASEKRMKRHWSEHHSRAVNGALDQAFAQQVQIQTFFRGTKIKYFEVRRCPERSPELEVESEQPLEREPVSADDLVKLNYFHHFTTSTTHTLPWTGTEWYWRSRVLPQALQLPWLMCGVLSIAAYHLQESSDHEVKQSHLTEASKFSRNFLEALEKSEESFVVHEASESDKIGAQLACLQQLCIWAIPRESDTSQIGSRDTSFELKRFIAVVRGCTDAGLALKALLDVDPQPTSPGPNASNPSISFERPSSNVPQVWAERLRTLPFRMAEVLPRPDSAADFFATAASLNCLIQCFALSYDADDAQSTWKAMTEWFNMVPKLFSKILRRDTISPAALVVVGHWVMLVQRAERHHWFLAGSAVKIMNEISEKLPQAQEAQNLLPHLPSDATAV